MPVRIVPSPKPYADRREIRSQDFPASLNETWSEEFPIVLAVEDVRCVDVGVEEIDRCQLSDTFANAQQLGAKSPA